MRETRTSGSVRGASGDGRPYRERDPAGAAGQAGRLEVPQTGPGAACPGAGGFWVFDAAAVASAGWTTQLVTGWSVCIPAQLDRTQRFSGIGLTSGSPR